LIQQIDVFCLARMPLSQAIVSGFMAIVSSFIARD
jgi:hypothetical protein